MTVLKQSLSALTLGIGLALLTASPGNATASAFFDHDRDYGYVRGIVDRTQSDLRDAVALEHGKRQGERYKNAQDHLSDFDRSLSKGHFDKDRLDHAIRDLQNLLDHNTLQARTREALRHDIEDLRAAREHHDR